MEDFQKAPIDTGIVKVRRRQGRSRDTRQKILAAATIEFAASGFDGVTTRSIAERAQIQHGLVVYHFESKLGVWEAVIENVFSDFHEEFHRRLAELKGCDAVTTLRGLHRNFIRMAATRPEMHWLTLHEVGSHSSRLTWLLDHMLGTDMKITTDLIRQAQAEGRYIEGDPYHLHFLFIGAASRVFVLGMDFEKSLGHSPFDPDFVEQHVEACERLFFRNL